jgi:hypothetical protein
MLIDNQPTGDFMKIRIALATLLAIGFVAATPLTYAAVANVHPSVHAFFFNGEKKIKFNMRNGTGVPLELKIGDKITTIKPGEVMAFKLPVGTRITSNTATEHLHVGDVVVEVTTAMYNDSTIAINK